MFGWLAIALESDKRDVNVDGDVRDSLVFLEKERDPFWLRCENARREKGKDTF